MRVFPGLIRRGGRDPGYPTGGSSERGRHRTMRPRPRWKPADRSLGLGRPFGPLYRGALRPHYGTATVYPVTVQFMVAVPLLKSVAHCNGLKETGST